MQLFQLKYIITEPKPRSNSSQINPGPPRFLWALSEMHQQITSTAANVSPSGWFVISAVSVTKFSQVGPPQSEPHQPTNMMISEKETVLQILDWAGLISWAELEKAGHGQYTEGMVECGSHARKSVMMAPGLCTWRLPVRRGLATIIGLATWCDEFWGFWLSCTCRARRGSH